MVVLYCTILKKGLFNVLKHSVSKQTNRIIVLVYYDCNIQLHNKHRDIQSIMYIWIISTEIYRAYGCHSIHGTEGRAKTALGNMSSGVNSGRGRGLIQSYTQSTVCQAGHGGTAIGKDAMLAEGQANMQNMTCTGRRSCIRTFIPGCYSLTSKHEKERKKKPSAD